jgi:NAD+-dependent farnesol dehydrogenase
MTMNVLVTGGTGYLGCAVVRALAHAGHQPIVFSRHPAASDLPGVRFDGDVRDARAVDAAVRRADAVCHAAALVSVWQKRSADFDDVNVRGLENVLEACERHRIRRIVYTSSFLALPPAHRATPLEANDYQRTKVKALGVARTARGRGLPISIMFPGVIYGPGALTEGNLIGRMVRDHLGRRLPGLIGSSRVWSYAYVEDVAAAHARAIEGDVEPADYVLGGENAPQIRVFEIVREFTGRRLPRRIPRAAATAVALIHEARASLTGMAPLLTRGVVKILSHDWPLESAESVRRLGYQITPLKIGLRELV